MSSLLPAAALLLGATPWLADVIPSGYGQKSPEQKAIVKARLESLGAPSAEERVKRLSPDELSFFAAQPERIQAAGGLWWYEFLFGLVFAAVLVLIYILLEDQT
jgi:hypothetical protein